jgi:hypothetical protein
LARTTLDIDASVLAELKRLQRERRQSLGALVSELLARALADEHDRSSQAEFQWFSKPMGAKIDLEDKEALNRILDGR